MTDSNDTDWLFDRISGHGEKPFLATCGQTHSYDELLVALERADLALSGKIPAGASIAILGDYSLESISSLLWLLKNRNIIVPIAGSADLEVRERCREAYCDFLIDTVSEPGCMHFKKLDDPGGTHELIEKLRGGNRAGLVLFSSGSAGKPKAMIHDLTNLVQIYADRKARNLSMIVFLMFDHIGGINTLFNSLASGSFMVAPVKRDAEEVAVLIQEHKVTILPTSPTFLNLLLIAEAPRQFDLSSLKIITYGTEPMPESLLLKLRETFPKVKFLQTFGTSETGISRTDSKSSGSLFMKLDDPDIEHKVVDGELWLRSKTQILGYLNHSMASFTEDGWFRTGDKVEVDESGYLRVVGRSKEMINVGGEKVVPSEVESVILEVNCVKDCTVFGQPSPVTGEIVAAKVLLNEGVDQAVAKSEIRKHCSARIARYKVPVKIIFVAESLFGDRFKKKRNLASTD
jgi:acyl-CoA synthetase (AMP-forming)/AMP-acid ligase II